MSCNGKESSFLHCADKKGTTDKGQQAKKYLRCVIFNEAVSICLLCLLVYRHPKTIFFYNTNLAVDLAYYILKLLKLFWRHNWQIVHNNNVGQTHVKFWRFLVPKHLFIITV
jgi:hypothetical protein